MALLVGTGLGVTALAFDNAMSSGPNSEWWNSIPCGCTSMSDASNWDALSHWLVGMGISAPIAFGGLTQEFSKARATPPWISQAGLEALEQNKSFTKHILDRMPYRTQWNLGLLASKGNGIPGLGLTGSSLLGGGLGLLSQLGSDIFGQRCLSPRQITIRALTSFGLSTLAGAAGVSLAALLPTTASAFAVGAVSLAGATIVSAAWDRPLPGSGKSVRSHLLEYFGAN
ncbi:hypothetical protein OSCT_3230 [Oscillochloris trichoides DG-6]|uniref:Uncharacterized protein n=1 Tax=Oscillochloris trichoides DG-6 TaxID=765420 RepID=E1IIS9_9CHLR|nr:hypothetical protein OSCT_3230 [Oscillochloris trichoides DG-6]